MVDLYSGYTRVMDDTEVPRIAHGTGNPGSSRGLARRAAGPPAAVTPATAAAAPATAAAAPASAAAAPASAADRRPALRYEALRFPGCRRISLTRDEFERTDDRIEYWDARAETAWVVADNYGVHEGTSRRLPHLAERIASVRGAPIVSFGSVTLLVRDAGGEPRRAMEADETLYLHPTRSTTPRRSLVVGEHDFPDVVLEVDYTTDVRPGKLLLYEAWGFPELWVIVPPEGASPRRPAGVTIHRLQDARYRSMPASGAFPGWTAAEIYHAMTEPTPSVATCRVLERVRGRDPRTIRCPGC